jgi:hypothetical protein
MNKCISIGFLISLLWLTSCQKNADIIKNEGDYLIFGKFYGFCGGETCIETYKLTSSTLYEDTKDAYRAIDGFEFVPLSTAKFLLVKDISADIPDALMKEDDKTFGCPDCYDQGGIFIQISKKEVVHSWFIDMTKRDVPDYLHHLMDAVNEKVILINN